MESQATDYESVAKGILKHHGRPQKLDRKDVMLHDGPMYMPGDVWSRQEHRSVAGLRGRRQDEATAGGQSLP